jgi:hypothetical protein
MFQTPILIKCLCFKPLFSKYACFLVFSFFRKKLGFEFLHLKQALNSGGKIGLQCPNLKFFSGKSVHLWAPDRCYSVCISSPSFPLESSMRPWPSCIPPLALVVSGSLVRREMRILPDKRSLSGRIVGTSVQRREPRPPAPPRALCLESHLHLVTWKGRAAHTGRATT